MKTLRFVCFLFDIVCVRVCVCVDVRSIFASIYSLLDVVICSEGGERERAYDIEALEAN